MKLRRTAPIVLALAALSSIAAVDADGIELPTEPCTNIDDASVFVPGDNSESMSAGTVTYPNDTAPDVLGVDGQTRNAIDVVIDLSTEDDNDYDHAVVNMTLSWTSPSDHELFVYDESGKLVAESTAFNPTDGSQESVFLMGVDHCSRLTVETKNYAGVPMEPMTLDADINAFDDEPDTVAGEDTTPEA